MYDSVLWKQGEELLEFLTPCPASSHWLSKVENLFLQQKM